MLRGGRIYSKGSQLYKAWLGERNYAREGPPLPVILKEDVPNLGSAGQSVQVAQGYAHNWLIPKRLAVYDMKARFGFGGKKKQRKKQELQSDLDASKASQELDSKQQELKQITQRLIAQPVVIKKKSLKGQETIEGQVTREVIVDAVARQCKVQMVPDFLEMNKPILKHGVYDIPVGILKPDGSQAVLELHVKVPKKQRRLYR